MLQTTHVAPAQVAGVATTPLADVLALPLSRATQVSGLSRSSIYRLAADGKLKLLKAGRSTLVDAGSLKALIESLPEAKIKAA